MMPDTTTHTRKKRDRIGVILYLVYFVMLLGSALLILRIIWLQLLFQPQPEIAARLTPSTTVRTIEPERGRILDCDGRLLAISCPEYQFYMDCTVLKDSNTPEEEKVWMDKARELSKGLAREFPGTTADQFYNLIRRSRETGRKYVKIGHEVDRQAYNRILQLPLFREGRYRSGVQVEQENVREYPYGELARRTIGFVRNNKSPVRNTHIGLEGKFDYELHGEEGREYLRETDHGTVRNSDSTLVRAVDGNDLRTTINIDYQDTVDKATGEVKLSAASKLAEVAVETAKTAKIFGIDPKVAVLSFSTKGSGKGGTVALSHDATIKAQEMAPDLAIDGELQFDAAVSPEVAKTKCKGSAVAGQANTFIFPCIEAGNIGYKIAQRLGGYAAYGPILQGLNAPINDLSRGCNADEVYKMSLITACQS